MKNFRTHVLNDSLQLCFHTPSDFDFITSEKALKKQIRKSRLKLNSVLTYGKTNASPFYEFYLTVNATDINTPDFAYHDSKQIGDQRIDIICVPLDDNEHSYIIDAKQILASAYISDDFHSRNINIFEILDSHGGSNNYLDGYNALSTFPTYIESDSALKLQLSLTYASFIRNLNQYDSLLNQWEREKPKDEIIDQISSSFSSSTEEFTELVDSIAASNKLIILNENHFYPQHRLVLTDLLHVLKSHGYNYLSLEALNIKFINDLNNGATLRLEHGFYTREQNFKKLIDKARELGFTLIAHEDTEESDNRELAQASNLYTQTFKADSTAKVIALVGIDHVRESKNGKRWMASYFEELYGINPVTISQTHLNTYRHSFDKLQFGTSDSLPDFYKHVDYHLINTLLPSSSTSDSTINYFNSTTAREFIRVFEKSDSLDYTDLVPYSCYEVSPNKACAIDIPNQADYILQKD